MHFKTTKTLGQLRDVSARGLAAGERAVERGFHDARLLASIAVGLLLVGFLLVAQWRGYASAGLSLERQSDQNLAIIIEQLTTENGSLRAEVIRLETRLAEAREQTRDRGKVLNEAAMEINALLTVSGANTAEGPGVVVDVVDAERVLLPQDFVALVNELRAGGAEAMSVNGVRVTARSGFSGSDGEVGLDGMVLARDYRVVAIGDPATLEQSLALPGGLKSTLSTFPGVSVLVTSHDELLVPAASTVRYDIGTPYEEK